MNVDVCMHWCMDGGVCVFACVRASSQSVRVWRWSVFACARVGAMCVRTCIRVLARWYFVACAQERAGPYVCAHGCVRTGGYLVG